MYMTIKEAEGQYQSQRTFIWDCYKKGMCTLPEAKSALYKVANEWYENCLKSIPGITPDELDYHMNDLWYEQNY